MSSSPTATLARSDACAIPGVRGVPSWGAILIALVFTAIGVVINLNVQPDNQDAGWALSILFVAGALLAALAVRRGAVFTAMVQPPLVLATAMMIGGLFDGKGLMSTGLDIVKAFPLMVIGTAATLVIGLIRIIVQPLRGRARYDEPRSRAHA